MNFFAKPFVGPNVLSNVCSTCARQSVRPDGQIIFQYLDFYNDEISPKIEHKNCQSRFKMLRNTKQH